MIFANDFNKNARLLLAGGVTAIPTEGVWGLSCSISEEHAIERVLRVKQRDPAKGLITLVTSFDELAHWFACPVLDVARDEIGRPSTWIIPVNSDCPRILTGGRDSLFALNHGALQIHRHFAQESRVAAALKKRSAHPSASIFNLYFITQSLTYAPPDH